MLLDILASMRRAEPEWSLHLIAADEGPLVSRARALGVTTTVVPFPAALARMGDAGAGGPAGKQSSRFALLRKLISAAPATGYYVRNLRRILRALDADLLHTNGFKMHILGAWAKPNGVPLVWHIHDYPSARPMMSRLMRRYSRRCAIAITNSDSVAADVKDVCGTGLTILTVYNGVDVERFSPTGPKLDLDSLAGLAPAPPDTIRIGMLATLARWKGHENFLRALSTLPRDYPFRGYVMGDAIYSTNGSQHSLKELKSLADDIGLTDRVGFTGFLSDPAEALRSLDIVVHASTQPEPFGLVIAEAMASGRALIVSNSGGAAELIEDEIDALGHPPGDILRLGERLHTLVTDSQLRARLGAAGRATAERRFDRARLATELIPIYRAATGASS